MRLWKLPTFSYLMWALQSLTQLGVPLDLLPYDWRVHVRDQQMAELLLDLKVARDNVTACKEALSDARDYLDDAQEGTAGIYSP